MHDVSAIEFFNIYIKMNVNLKFTWSTCIHIPLAAKEHYSNITQTLGFLEQTETHHLRAKCNVNTILRWKGKEKIT